MSNNCLLPCHVFCVMWIPPNMNEWKRCCLCHNSISTTKIFCLQEPPISPRGSYAICVQVRAGLPFFFFSSSSSSSRSSALIINTLVLKLILGDRPLSYSTSEKTYRDTSVGVLIFAVKSQTLNCWQHLFLFSPYLESGQDARVEEEPGSPQV